MHSDIFQSVGFNEKAAKIYLTALSLGTASVQKIAATAQIKRPTAYVHISELVRSGWLEKVPIGKREYYRSMDPMVLKQRAKENWESIQRALPELTKLYTAQRRPSVSVFEGARAISELHSEIASANSIRFWSQLDIFEDTFPEAVAKLSSKIVANQIRTREIISDSPATKRAAKRYAAIAGKYYSCRVTQGTIHNNSAIYGDTVLLFRLQNYNLSVVRIDDAAIATTLKTLFDLAWQAAEPFIPTLHKRS